MNQYTSLIIKYLINILLKIEPIKKNLSSSCYDIIDRCSGDLDIFLKLGWSRSQFKIQLSKKNNCTLGLYHNNILEGFVVGDLINIEKIIEYEILLIYIKIEKRKRGYATKLLEYIPVTLKKEQFKKIYLEVAANNKNAIKLYEKNNFKKKGIRKEYYILNGIKVDAIFFEKIIDE